MVLVWQLIAATGFATAVFQARRAKSLIAGREARARLRAIRDDLNNHTEEALMATSTRAQRAARLRAIEGVPEWECLAEMGCDPEDCDCAICDQGGGDD